jgi:HAD superfamily hydrolase (TIGR01509 family)
VSDGGLVLDFDGTVLDTEEPIYRSWQELWAEHGHELALADWQATIGTEGVFDPWDQLERRVGRPLDPAWHDRRRARRDELQARHHLRPGILAWLDAAGALDIPVGVASSSSVGWVSGHLERLGIRQHFQVIVGVDDAVPPKPDPSSYLRCCHGLGVDPTCSVAVEDSVNGVAAASSAGLYTVAVPHALTEDLDFSRADVVVASLATLSLSDALDAAGRKRAVRRAPRPRAPRSPGGDV